MPTQSLDELIAHKAADFAEQVRNAALMAANEADVRHAVVEQLAFIKQAAGVELKAQNEFTVASGRIDSVYSRVVIEYKNPKSPGDKIGPRADSPGSLKVVKQIKKRFQDLERELGHAQKDLFGVGLDGLYFIFVRYRDDKWHVQDPVEVNKVSAARFLWALFNLGHKGKAFQPEYLAGDFGAETTSLLPACTRSTTPSAPPKARGPRHSSSSGRFSSAKSAATTWIIRPIALRITICAFSLSVPTQRRSMAFVPEPPCRKGLRRRNPCGACQ